VKRARQAESGPLLTEVDMKDFRQIMVFAAALGALGLGDATPAWSAPAEQEASRAFAFSSGLSA